MKTTHYLVAAAAVAAVTVTVCVLLPNKEKPPAEVPLVADASPPPAGDSPPLPLPPVSPPPDEPLAMPAVTPAPASAPPTATVTPISAEVPVIPSVPLTPPVVPAVPVPDVPPLPLPLPLPKTDVPPLPLPLPKIDMPPMEVFPLPTPTPVLQPPVAPVTAKPNPAPALVATGGRYVVLKDDKMIEGTVSLRGETVVVRQGSLDRPFTKGQVQFVATTRDEVYRFMLAKVPATDAAARLKVARWCMFTGLREQALTEAREVQKIQPNSAAAADLIRSLELSLKQYPPEGAPKMTPPVAPTFPATLTPAPPAPPVVEVLPDVTPEADALFATRVQPFLANKCVECHANPEHASTFKLVRVTPTDAGPKATRTNLHAVASQLKKTDPASSPLLVKTLSAHGGMKLPAVANRHVAVYQTLEAWVVLAVGKPVAAPITPVPTPPVTPAPSLPPTIPPADPLAPALSPAVPLIPPADTAPKAPTVPPIPTIPPGAALPKPPGAMMPVNGGQFGADKPPKLPPTGPTGGDEFDPAGFNQTMPQGK